MLRERQDCSTHGSAPAYNRDMQSPITAIYENGVLRPLEPLDLEEHAVVSLAIVGVPAAAPDATVASPSPNPLPIPGDEEIAAWDAASDEAWNLIED